MAIPTITAGDVVRVRRADGTIVRRMLSRAPIRHHTGRMVFFAAGWPGCFNVESVVEVVRAKR